jgi:hypothetical protein
MVVCEVKTGPTAKVTTSGGVTSKTGYSPWTAKKRHPENGLTESTLKGAKLDG